jgi:MFS family permease
MRVGQGVRSKAAVLGERNFRTFYTGYVTSLLGTSMSTVAIAFAVLDTGASPTDLGYVFAAAVVPQVLLMAFAGAVADRFGRRRVMHALISCAAARKPRSRSCCLPAGRHCGCSSCSPGWAGWETRSSGRR